VDARQWELLVAVVRGETIRPVPAGFIVDSPWLPNWAGRTILDYFTQDEAFFDDKRCEYRWILNRGEDLVVERDFQVARVRIDREDVPVLRTENTKRGYEVWCGGDDLRRKLNRPVKVEIEIRTKKAKSNRNFSVYLVYPTRGLDILFDYRGMNFRNVKEVTFFAGRHPYPQVIREKGKSVRIKISDEEWIFPNSGVSFIWDV